VENRSPEIEDSPGFRAWRAKQKAKYKRKVIKNKKVVKKHFESPIKTNIKDEN